MNDSEEIHLVYMVPYLGAKWKNNMRVHEYTKLNGTTDEHKQTNNKMQFQNCYSALVPGENYIIVTKDCKVGKAKRGVWVFEKCYKLEEPSMATNVCTLIKAIEHEECRSSTTIVPGYVTTYNIFKEAAVAVVTKWLDNKQSKESTVS